VGRCEPELAEDHDQSGRDQQHRHHEDADLREDSLHQKSSRSANAPLKRNWNVAGASTCASVNGSYGMSALSVTRNGDLKYEPPYCMLGRLGRPRQFGPPVALTIGRLSGYVYDGTPNTKLELTIAPGL